MSTINTKTGMLSAACELFRKIIKIIISTRIMEDPGIYFTPIIHMFMLIYGIVQDSGGVMVKKKH